jgi:hypothetical protein
MPAATPHAVKPLQVNGTIALSFLKGLLFIAQFRPVVNQHPLQTAAIWHKKRQFTRLGQFRFSSGHALLALDQEH